MTITVTTHHHLTTELKLSLSSYACVLLDQKGHLVRMYVCVARSASDVGRETTHHAPAAELRESRRGRAASLQHVRDSSSGLRTGADPDS